MPKICGITNKEDAEEAMQLGFTALGFNFYSASPRFLSFNDLDWISHLSKNASRIALVVNANLLFLEKLAATDLFDAVQFHGDETAEFCLLGGQLFPYWIKAIRLNHTIPRDSTILNEIQSFKTDWLIFDALFSNQYGGTGRLSNWDFIKNFIEKNPHTQSSVAGGLTPENVISAYNFIKPHSLDICSSIEQLDNPRKKDHKKMKYLMQNLASIFSKNEY